MTEIKQLHKDQRPSLHLSESAAIFLTPSLNQQLQHIRLGCEQRHPLQILAAPQGHGRSTLAKNLAKTLPAYRVDAHIIALTGPEAGTNWLLPNLANFFGIASGRELSRAELWVRILAGLDDLQNDHTSVTIIIDSCERLTQPEHFQDLQALLDIQSLSKPSVSFVLIGDASVFTPMIRANLRTKLTYQGKVEAMSELETRGFINHLLTENELPTSTFSDSAVDAIFAFAQGNFSLTANIAAAALTRANVQNAEIVSGADVIAVGDAIVGSSIPSSESKLARKRGHQGGTAKSTVGSNAIKLNSLFADEDV